MRKSLVLLAVLAAGLAVVCPGDAGQLPTSTATGGNSAGTFFSGFMPTNIVNQPVNIGNPMTPISMQPAMMPQQQSTKVFNINSAFKNIQIPAATVFRSKAPQVPVVSPGTSNPLQPTNPINLQPVNVQQQSTQWWWQRL